MIDRLIELVKGSSRTAYVFWAVLIFAVSFGLFLFYGWHPLWDGEAMYAEAPREMLLSGDFIRPTLNFAPFLFKPPLFVWTNAAWMAVFGVGEVSVRFPTALFAAGTVLATFLIGARSGLRTGIFSAFALATSYGFVLHTSMMLTDIPLAFFTACSVYFFIMAAEEGGGRGVYGMYACLGLAVMTKGLIGLVFPGLAFGSYILFGRRWGLLKMLASPVGIALFLAITVPWHAMAEARQPGFLREFVINEQVMRFFNKRYPPDHDMVSDSQFLLINFGWLMPWAAFLPQALYRAVKGGVNGRGMAFHWGIAGMAFLCLSSSKLEYYALPVFPAFALITGGYWASATQDGGRAKGLVAGLYVLAAFSLAAALISPVLASNVNEGLDISRTEAMGYARIAVRCFVPLFLGAVASVLLLKKGRTGAAFAALAVGALLLSVSARASLDMAAQYFSTADAAKVVAKLPAGTAVVVDGELEYEDCSAFCFYTGRKVYILKNHGNPMLADGFTGGGSFMLNDGDFAGLWGSGRAVAFATIRDPAKEAIAGIPSAGFSEVCRGSRTVYVNR